MSETTRSATTPSAPASDSTNDQAGREFLSRAWEVSGVSHVERTPGGPLSEQTITVHVPELRSEAAKRVFELEGELRRRFPGAGLKIRVKGEREHAGSSHPEPE